MGLGGRSKLFLRVGGSMGSEVGEESEVNLYGVHGGCQRLCIHYLTQSCIPQNSSIDGYKIL